MRTVAAYLAQNSNEFRCARRAARPRVAPPGPGRAHQIVNDADAPLKYLALSSMDTPEICYYPDSNKTGAFHITDKGFEGFMSRDGELADYWDGED